MRILFIFITLLSIFNSYCAPKVSIDSGDYRILWQREFKDSVYYSRTVHIIIDSSDNKLFFLSENGYFEVADGKTGKSICNYLFGKTEDHYLQEPVVCNGGVYFGNTKGNYYGINIKTCSLALSIRTLSNKPKICIDPQSGVVSGNKIVIGGSGGGDFRIQALNIKTSEVLWEHKFDDETIESKPVTNGKFCYFLARHMLLAIDFEGTIKWKHKGGFASTEDEFPVCDGNVVYYSTPEFVYAINAESGKEIWKIINLQKEFISPYVSNNRLYTHAESSSILCVDSKNGKKMWQTSLPKQLDLGSAQLTIINSFIACALIEADSDNWQLCLINSNDGAIKKIIKLPLGENFNDQPLVFQNNLILRSTKDLEGHQGYHYQIIRMIKLL